MTARRAASAGLMTLLIPPFCASAANWRVPTSCIGGMNGAISAAPSNGRRLTPSRGSPTAAAASRWFGSLARGAAVRLPTQLLYWRARNGSIRVEHAAVSCLRAKHCGAGPATICGSSRSRRRSNRRSDPSHRHARIVHRMRFADQLAYASGRCLRPKFLNGPPFQWCAATAQVGG